MSTVFRRNRKNSDADIIARNRLGLSLATIANELSCHPTSITLRLQSLKIPPADTRRAFMEAIYAKQPMEFRDQVLSVLEEGNYANIKDYVEALMIKDIAARQTTSTPALAMEQAA